ncbi:germination protein YpeB [Pseudalkalibacillus caeni]|uniref:Germination protein YpeB n=1 Tax=Exobacillus caeni TaxID=2574798 RepID=A0A5R9F1W6_9BACL|nr:germination protein YpeB [Pseudalkalibacillus caeni]TLS34893.1 germination protein YpeB [Pseudalkalibacillus caeni]
MIRSILIGILSVAIAGTAYWGYKEHQEKNAVLINAENNYQRAFHELSFHMDALEGRIGASLAMSSPSRLSPALADVWRITSEAHNDVGQLPLTLLPFNKTEEYLANVGEFSYRVAVRDLDKKPLSEKEYQTLKDLHKNATEIKNELRKVQALAMKNNLRWMDVELALASEKQPQDNTIIDGFKTVDKKVEGYSEVSGGAGVSQINGKNEGITRNLSGKRLSEEEAKKRGRDFFGLNPNTPVKVTKTGKETDYDAYSLAIEGQDQNGNIYMDISVKGGHPIWILQDRKIGKETISLNEASRKATQFLEKHDGEGMILSESFQYDNVGVFNFVYEEDGVRYYPDSIQIKVALDKGDVIGYEAIEYLTNHKERKTSKPKIDRNKALKEVNPNVKVMEDHLAVIENELEQEVLCYEFLGTMENETYRIFINAMTGEEEKVDELDGTEMSYENL